MAHIVRLSEQLIGRVTGFAAMVERSTANDRVPNGMVLVVDTGWIETILRIR